MLRGTGTSALRALRRLQQRWGRATLRLRQWNGRVPVLRQQSAIDCGAACLAMIVSYHGRSTTIAECSLLCNAGRDGVNARTLMAAARRLGLEGRALSTEPSELGSLPLPAIAHWDFSHFVVIERARGETVTIVDPGGGRRTVESSELGRRFTGVLLTFTPGPEFERRFTADTSWVEFVRRIFQTPDVRRLIASIGGASVALQALGLVLPLVTLLVIDYVIPYHSFPLLGLIGIGVTLFVLMHVLIGYVRNIVTTMLRARIDESLMRDFLHHLLSLPLRFFQVRTGGDLVLRLGSNSYIRETLTNQTLSLFLDGSLVIVYLLLLLAQSVPLALIALALALTQVTVVLAMSRRIREYAQRDLATKAEEQSYLVELVGNIATVKAAGAEEIAFTRWSGHFTKYLNASLGRSYFAAKYESVLGLLRLAAPIALLWVGARLVLTGDLSVGMMLALNTLAASFLAPVAALVTNVQQLQTVRATLERLMDVLVAEPEQSNGGRGRLHAPLGGEVAFEGVSFRYSPDAPDILSDLTFTARPGEVIAIVGPTGSGKSTIGRLLLGLYEPSSGRVLIDGVPIGDHDLRRLRAQIGVVLQEAALFSGTIGDNIRLTRPGASWDEVVRASTIAGIHEEIVRMPLGYETAIAEGGGNMSGGQRQRIALARAIVGSPRLLLLDEATSHLDGATEAAIDARLRQLSCTRILIAHRLSTIRGADQILVLHDGRIIERGRHDDLVARGGWYARLVGEQLDSRGHDLRPAARLTAVST